MIGALLGKLAGKPETPAATTRPTAAERLVAAARAYEDAQATTAAISAELATLDTEIGGLIDENKTLALLAFRGDQQADARITTVDARLEDVQRRARRLRVALDEAKRDEVQRCHVKDAASHDADVEALGHRAAELQTAGIATEQAAREFVAALRGFVEADFKASAMAHALGTTEGRQLQHRLADALSHHLMGVLIAFGTDFTLNVTAGNRKVDFIAASRRPFSPRQE